MQHIWSCRTHSGQAWAGVWRRFWSTCWQTCKKQKIQELWKQTHFIIITYYVVRLKLRHSHWCACVFCQAATGSSSENGRLSPSPPSGWDGPGWTGSGCKRPWVVLCALLWESVSLRNFFFFSYTQTFSSSCSCSVLASSVRSSNSSSSCSLFFLHSISARIQPHRFIDSEQI